MDKPKKTMVQQVYPQTEKLKKQGSYVQRTWRRSPPEDLYHQKKQVQQTTEIPQKANNHSKLWITVKTPRNYLEL